MKERKSQFKKVPPFQYYLVFTLLSAIFLLFLDFNFRGDALIKHLSFYRILTNGTVVFIFLFIVSTGVSLVLWGLEFVLTKIITKVSVIGYRAGSGTAFLLFLLFVYVNLNYLKFYLGNFVVDSLKTAVKVVMLLLVVLVAAYFAGLKRKFKYKYAKDNVGALAKASLYVFTICVIFFGIFYIVDWTAAGSNENIKTGNSQKPDVILITCDSLGARHMSTYEYKRKTTPNITSFAKESCNFKRMHMNANETMRAMNCILGLSPRPLTEKRLEPGSFVTELKKQGYKKRYFVTFSRYKRGFHTDFTDTISIKRFDVSWAAGILYQGENRVNFQWLSELLSEDWRYVNLFSARHPKDYNLITEPIYPLPDYFNFAIKKMEEDPKPVFIWMHLFEPHYPFIVPEPYHQYFGKGNVNRYDSSIRYLDHEFGRFIGKLKQQNLYQNSLIILTSDHGESFGEEHGGWRGFLHGTHWLNESVNHIPLIIHLPGQQEGVEPETFASQVDVAPTIMEAIGAPIPDWMEGESLIKFIENPDLLSNRLKIVVPNSHFLRQTFPLKKKPKAWAVNNEDMFNIYWKKYKIGWFQIYGPNKKNPQLINDLIRFQYYCIYDMFKDPEEKNNLLNEPEFDGILRKIYESKLVKFYRQ